MSKVLENPSRISSTVWVLGFVSLMMDISSEIVHSLLPIYLVTTVGVSTVAIGIIEGVAEATAQIVKIFSGALSDYLGKRKGLAVIGYGLGAISKPIFALSSSFGWVCAARLVDRVGKGIRGAPRDALIADVVPSNMRGAAYGLRQSLDTVGAFMGPVLAIGLMWLWANDFQVVFWFAAIPGTIAVILLIFGIKEPAVVSNERRKNPISRESLRQLNGSYWWVVGIGAVYTLARFSEAFLLLRAEFLGLDLIWVPVVLVVMNLAYTVSAFPSGKLSDKIGPKKLLVAGMLLLILADLILALAHHWFLVLLGAMVWGFHMGMSQGVLMAMVADHSPSKLRGTAFGFFNLICGGATLIASFLAGVLWEWSGPSITFIAGMFFCLLSIIGLILFGNRRPIYSIE